MGGIHFFGQPKKDTAERFGLRRSRFGLPTPSVNQNDSVESQIPLVLAEIFPRQVNKARLCL